MGFEFAEQIMSLTPQLRSEVVEITGGRRWFCSYPHSLQYPPSFISFRGGLKNTFNGPFKIFWVKFWMIGKILNKNFPKKIRKMKNPHFLGGGVNDGILKNYGL